MIKILLLLFAIVGSIEAYFIINTFIIPVSVTGFIGIEVTVTLLHTVYNRTKRQLLKYYSK